MSLRSCCGVALGVRRCEGFANLLYQLGREPCLIEGMVDEGERASIMPVDRV